MEIQSQIGGGGSNQFRTTIHGVTFRNSEGEERQSLIKLLRPGQSLSLRREPENTHDRFAVAIFSDAGQLGYLPAGDARLAGHMDMGGSVSAKVVKVTGRIGWFAKFFGAKEHNCGCVIEITKGDIDWKRIAPYMDADREIQGVLNKAKSLEESSPTKAIAAYRAAGKMIIELDSNGKLAAGCRRARYPIARLSLVLEKVGNSKEALLEIEQYESLEDQVGISAADRKSIEARKARLAKKVNATQS